MRAVLVPQLFVAATETVPPEMPEIAVMEVVEDVPDQPEGNVQI